MLGRPASSYWLTRFLILRLLGFVYFFAFLSLATQVLPLVGHDGLLPADSFLERVAGQLGSRWEGFVTLPSVFWTGVSDGALVALSWLGVALSLVVLSGLANAILLAGLWALYMSQWIHRAGALFNYFAELVAPWLAFVPLRFVAGFAGAGMLLLQAILLLSGNLSFLNWLTIVPILACFDDAILGRVLPRRLVSWTVRLVSKLLQNDRGTLSLLGNDPFPASPPRWVRARLYRYEFEPPEAPSGAWWKRTLVGEWLPPLSAANGWPG